MLPRGVAPVDLPAAAGRRLYFADGVYLRCLAAGPVVGAAGEPRQRGARCPILWRQDLHRLLGQRLLDAILLPRLADVERELEPDQRVGVD